MPFTYEIEDERDKIICQLLEKRLELHEKLQESAKAKMIAEEDKKFMKLIKEFASREPWQREINDVKKQIHKVMKQITKKFVGILNK